MCACWRIKPKDRPGFGDLFVDMTKRYQCSLEENINIDSKTVVANEAKEQRPATNEPPTYLTVTAESPVKNDYEVPYRQLESMSLQAV